MAELLKGKPVADAMKAELIKKVEGLKAKGHCTEARHHSGGPTSGRPVLRRGRKEDLCRSSAWIPKYSNTRRT